MGFIWKQEGSKDIGRKRVCRALQGAFSSGLYPPCGCCHCPLPRGKAEPQRGPWTGLGQGLTQGLGPTQTHLTPRVTECSQVSPRNPGPGSPDAGVDFGVTQCHPLLCDHKEEPRKGGSLPEQWVESIFRNFRHKGDPHHLQVRLLEED